VLGRDSGSSSHRSSGERFCTAEEGLAFCLREQEIFALRFWIHREARESAHDRADALGRDEVVAS
jgi:hypothetical protein